MFDSKKIIACATKRNKTIVFPEAGFSDRIVEAGKMVYKKKIANVIFIGDESALIMKYKGLDGITIINPKTSDLTNEFVDLLMEKRADKGMTEKKAKELVLDPIYFATLLVEADFADGMVGGAETSTADNIRPALQIIKSEKAGEVISSCNIVFGKNKFLGKNNTLVLGDCGLNINPTSEELAQIATNCILIAKQFCAISPKVAMLSFSTKGSAQSIETKKVIKATLLAKELNPDIIIDGEMQIDAALSKQVAELKAPESKIQGDANVLVFPELQSGNICYKAFEKIGGLTSIGPIMQGFKKPINDISRSAKVSDIILLTAITVLQCK